jgi:hypothetical protein
MERTAGLQGAEHAKGPVVQNRSRYPLIEQVIRIGDEAEIGQMADIDLGQCLLQA